MRKYKILCTICARGGSKGVKNKNLKFINGTPLITHTIKQAIKSNLFKNIIVSSDSEKIINIAKKSGADVLFKRPKKLSNDSAPKIPVIIHALKKAEIFYKTRYDLIIDLDPTSPLRDISDIQKALNIFEKNKANNLITASKAKKSPYFNMIEIINNKISIIKKKKYHSINRRQDSPKVFDMNASIYIWSRKYLLNKPKLINSKTALYIMPEERSIDIDSEFDFKITKYIFENKKLFK